MVDVASQAEADAILRMQQNQKGFLPGTSEPRAIDIEPRRNFGATQIVDVPEAYSAALTAGSTTSLIRVGWPSERGIVLAAFGGTVDGAEASLSSIGVRIKIDGNTDIFCTESGEAYVRLIALAGRNREWLPLANYRVSSNTPWFVQFKNFHASTSFTPFLHFQYRRVTG